MLQPRNEVYVGPTIQFGQVTLTRAWWKYVSQPLRNDFNFDTIRATLTPRFRRVI